MMHVIAWGLEVGHPAAYLLIFLILGIPLLAVILLGGALVIEKLQEKREDRRNRRD